MSDTDAHAAGLFRHDRFPRSAAYDARWIAENQMGPNVLWLAEWLMEAFSIEPGMRVLDLGCGRAASSIFIAKETGATVFATDLWIHPADNWGRIREAGLEDRVVPIHAEAHALPFAEGFFDAIVSLDAYPYFGTDDLYLSYITRFLAPGGRLGVVSVGLTAELDGPPPDHLCQAQENGATFWESDCCTFHCADWWRRHWAKTGRVRVELADTLLDGWRYWAQHERAVEAMGAGVFPSVEQALLTDAGRTIAIVRVLARCEQDPDPAPPRGHQPHVWEPAFMSVCDKLLTARTKRGQDADSSE